MSAAQHWFALTPPGLPLTLRGPATPPSTGLTSRFCLSDRQPAIYVCRGQKDGWKRNFSVLIQTPGQGKIQTSSDETYLRNVDYERADGSTLVFPSHFYGSVYHQSLTRFHPTARNTPTTVVEYYSRDAKRFFITASYRQSRSSTTFLPVSRALGCSSPRPRRWCATAAII